MSETRMAAAGTGSGRMLALLVALFAMPVAVAAGLYFSGWRSTPSAAHGVLMRPPVPAAGMALGTAGGRAVHLGDFRSKWILLYFGPADCPATCRRNLYAMRQAHVAQGPGQERVQRVFVAQGAVSAVQADAGTTVVAGKGAGWSEGVYLVDPLGNLVMSYGADADADGLRKDLARLLAYSWVG